MQFFNLTPRLAQSHHRYCVDTFFDSLKLFAFQNHLDLDTAKVDVTLESLDHLLEEARQDLEPHEHAILVERAERHLTKLTLLDIEFFETMGARYFTRQAGRPGGTPQTRP